MSHRTIRLMLLASALIAPLLVLIAPVRAVVLFQDGFESASVGADGGFVGPLTTEDPAWTQLTAGGTLNGLLNPTSDSYYSGTTGDNPATDPANMEGIQVAAIINLGGEGPDTFSHTLTDDLILGDVYDLSISVGWRINGTVATSGYSLELLANGVVLDSVSSDGSDLTRDTFKRVTFSYTPIATDPIGQPLEIRFGTTQTGASLAATEFDAVELDQTHVPEPASASLLAAAFCALLARRGRGAGRKAHIIS